MICSECKSEFKVTDRIKSMNKRKGRIQCENCKSTFVIKGNSGRVESAVLTGIIVFTMSLIGGSLIRKYPENKIMILVLICCIAMIISLIYYFMAQNRWKYEKVNDDLEK